MTREEVEVLIEYNRGMQLQSSNKEEYSDAAYYKERAQYWRLLIEKKLKVVEEEHVQA